MCEEEEEVGCFVSIRYAFFRYSSGQNQLPKSITRLHMEEGENRIVYRERTKVSQRLKKEKYGDQKKFKKESE